nr:hypothetical protein [Rhodococcus sp. EPR-157]
MLSWRAGDLAAIARVGQIPGGVDRAGTRTRPGLAAAPLHRLVEHIGGRLRQHGEQDRVAALRIPAFQGLDR